MNLSKKVTYIITFLIVFVALPYGIYVFYYNYQVKLYEGYSDYSAYTTKDGTYTVKVMDTKSFGSEDYVKVKLYLVNNVTDEVSYISGKKLAVSNLDISYAENVSDDTYDILVTFDEKGSTSTVKIDCLEGTKG
jgi:hypothetical protein